MANIYKRGDHRTQFDGGPKAASNCTAASLANGMREQSDGKYDHSGSYVRALVKQSEETNPDTPGWSLSDADLAASRAGQPFNKGTGGWSGVKANRALGRGILLQGDSDQFSNGTCSGAFDGDHAVYIHPETSTADGVTYWLTGDPICANYRWERESELRDYASKLSAGILYGVFPTPVPKLAVPTEDDMTQLTITDTVPKLVDTAKDGLWYDLGGTALPGKHEAMTNRFSPYAAGAFRAIYVTPSGGPKVLALVKPVAVKPIPKAPDTTPYGQASLDAAKVNGKAEGIQAEKARMRTVLGL